MDNKIKINMAEQPWQECECGCTVFEEKMMFKRISGLLTGQPKPQLVPVQVIVCTGCKKVPGFVQDQLPPLPENLYASLDKKDDQIYGGPGSALLS